jgi:hypothetical protein
MKTSELIGDALDWAVAKCEGVLMRWERSTHDEAPLEYSPSTDWAQGGPIIEREKMTLEWTGEDWMAYIRHDEEYFGPTPLIAAMRCYVASKQGEQDANENPL